MGNIKQFEDLPIWKQAIEIAEEIYKIAENDKLKNEFSTQGQVKRVALSLSSNVDEGYEYNNKDFIRSLRYAKGSAGELRSQMYILMKLNFVQDEDYKRINALLLQISNRYQGLRNICASTSNLKFLIFQSLIKNENTSPR